MNYRIALLIGRFQPFHLGHLYLIKKTLEIAEKVIIGIGSASILDENNPLDFETRKNIIKAVFYKEKIEKRLIKIVALEDFFDDRKWLNNVKDKAGKFDIVVSNNDWTNNIMEKAGLKVKRFPYFKRELYEGWRIRKLISLGKEWRKRIPSYLTDYFESKISKQVTSHQSSLKLRPAGLSLITKLNHIVIGGTFDHFHKGHIKLLTTAFKFGEKVTIGVATEELYKNKKLNQSIESIDLRKKSVSEFLKKNNWDKRAKIIYFSDFTGGVDKRADVDGIVVSKMTYENALKINEKREKNKLEPLRMIIIKDILAEDGKLLSSERIRAGEIDQEGKVYDLRFKNKKVLLMPESLREELRKPLGRIFKSTEELLQCFKTLKWTMLIAVGDIIVDSLLKAGINPDVKVIDFRSRKMSIKRTVPFWDSPKKGLSLENKPGTINLKTAEKLRRIIQKGTVLIKDSPYSPYNSWFVIDGEEDLLTLPAILFAPLGSLVLYGHWQFGIIAVYIDEPSKKKSKILLNQFKI